MIIIEDKDIINVKEVLEMIFIALFSRKWGTND